MRVSRETRRAPPFARAIRERLADPDERRRAAGSSPDGARCTVWVAVGAGAWDWVREHPSHLATLLPDNTEPHSLDWSVLRGHAPILVVPASAATYERLQALAVALLQDGCDRVMVLGATGEGRPLLFTAEGAE